METWQASLFAMGEKMEALEEINNASEKSILRFKHRISELEENIGEAKKMCMSKTN